MNTDVIAAPRYRDSSVFVLEPSPAPFHPIPLETLLKPAEFEQVQWVELSRNATIAGVTIIAFVPVDILTHRPIWPGYSPVEWPSCCVPLSSPPPIRITRNGGN